MSENLPPTEDYTDGSFLVEEYSRYRRIGAIFVLVALALLIVATIFIALTQQGNPLPTPTPEVGMIVGTGWL